MSPLANHRSQSASSLASIIYKPSTILQMSFSKRFDVPSTRTKFRKRLESVQLDLDNLKAIPRDEKLPIDLIEDCVEPRLRSLKSDFEKEASARSHSSFLGIESKWLQPGGRYQNRLAHVELMLYLIRRRAEISRNDWIRIANWQLATYREACHRLQLTYFKATKAHTTLPAVQSIRAILVSTRKSAYAQRDHLDAADVYDAFSPRNVFDHPELRGLLAGDLLDVKAKEEMHRVEEGLVSAQPAFPKWCYEEFLGYEMTPSGGR